MSGPEVGLFDGGVLEEVASGAGQGDGACLEHVAPVGDLEGLVGHLLDEQDPDHVVLQNGPRHAPDRGIEPGTL